VVGSYAGHGCRLPREVVMARRQHTGTGIRGNSYEDGLMDHLDDADAQMDLNAQNIEMMRSQRRTPRRSTD